MRRSTPRPVGFIQHHIWFGRFIYVLLNFACPFRTRSCETLILYDKDSGTIAISDTEHAKLIGGNDGCEYPQRRYYPGLSPLQPDGGRHYRGQEKRGFFHQPYILLSPLPQDPRHVSRCRLIFLSLYHPVRCLYFAIPSVHCVEHIPATKRRR